MSVACGSEVRWRKQRGQRRLQAMQIEIASVIAPSDREPVLPDGQ
jgi:hypothetical protein